MLMASSMPTSALDMAGSFMTPWSRFCDAHRMSIHTKRGLPSASRVARILSIASSMSRSFVPFQE